jgi:hypothetical protein
MAELKPITINDILNELRDLGVGSKTKDPEAKTMETLMKEWGYGATKTRKILKQLKENGYLTCVRSMAITIDNRPFPVPGYIIKIPPKAKTKKVSK